LNGHINTPTAASILPIVHTSFEFYIIANPEVLKKVLLCLCDFQITKSYSIHAV